LRQAFTRMRKRYLAMVSRTLDQERANHVPMGQHTTIAAAIRQAFPQRDADAAHQTLAPCRRPAKRALAQARCADGRKRTRRAGLPGFPGPAPHQDTLNHSAGAVEQGSQTTG